MYRQSHTASTSKKAQNFSATSKLPSGNPGVQGDGVTTGLETFLRDWRERSCLFPAPTSEDSVRRLY